MMTLTPRLRRFKDSQARQIYFESKEYKDAEKARREASRPTEHIILDNGKTFCPEEGKIRPTWMCEYDHGDRSPADYQPYEPEEER